MKNFKSRVPYLLHQWGLFALNTQTLSITSLISGACMAEHGPLSVSLQSSFYGHLSGSHKGPLLALDTLGLRLAGHWNIWITWLPASSPITTQRLTRVLTARVPSTVKSRQRLTASVFFFFFFFTAACHDARKDHPNNSRGKEGPWLIGQSVCLALVYFQFISLRWSGPPARLSHK